MNRFQAFLQEEKIGIAYEAPFLTARHASIGVGGLAPIAFYPSGVAEAIGILSRLEKKNIPYRVLGNMTNVLPPDQGIEEAYVITRRMRKMDVGEKLFAEAGVMSGALVHACMGHGLGGVEFLVGIPCTVGGAAFMNAGVQGRYMNDVLESVLVYESGEVKTLPVSECGYAYKESVFMHGKKVILGATFRLKKTGAKSVAEKRAEYLRRRANLPVGKSMGCVFKNPSGQSAGKLIEGAGLKGLRLGGAYVSEQHANFIINGGGATASEIEKLIQVIKNAVRAQYGIELEEEIRYLDKTE